MTDEQRASLRREVEETIAFHTRRYGGQPSKRALLLLEYIRVAVIALSVDATTSEELYEGREAVLSTLDALRTDLVQHFDALQAFDGPD